MLPRGNCISEESWRRRHAAIVALLWAHVAIVFIFGIATHHGVGHSLLETSMVIALAIGASSRAFSPTARSVLATLGLVTSSALLTHFSHGLIEMHFHFFVVVAVVTLYQSWLPFATAIGYVLFHHGIMGALDPASVYNDPEAIANPWKWAAIHALFIAGESIACVTAWRLNEDALESERRARGDLVKANEDLAEAQQLAKIGSWELDLDTDALWWSDEMYRISGLDRETFVPTVSAFMGIVHSDDRVKIASLLAKANKGSSSLSVDCKIVQPDGTIRVIHAIGTATTARRMVGTCQDVTDQKALEDEIQHKAFHDPLTGLANRGLFRDRLTHAHHRRHPRDPLAVIFLDLDDFKAVNDSLGHATGDELLIAVARLLETLVRPSDTIARFGGDEFAILVDDTDNETAAIAVAKRIGGALRQTLSLESGEVTVRASIGIAIEDELSSPDDLLRDADIAMYAVKDQDKDGYEVCDDDMRTNALRRLEVKQELKRAILDEEFVLHFQPIVKLDTQDLVAVEALVRWNHPQWGMVPPNDFIPVAEESALIVPLGEWILREATSQAKGLQETLGKRFAVSVNLSARQLEEQDIVRVVRDALDLSGLPASDLILEITETVLVGNKEETSRTLKELRDMGVQIAIDDFGTGYSSLSYLHRFPFDILKIDRAFIGGVDEGPEEAALAQAVIQLASVLNVYTVAEGIETDGQLERLKSFGCSTGQGFLFSRPLPMTELRAWFADGAERDPALASI